MNLSDLAEGERGIITKVKGRGSFRKRISEMGFVRGKAITRIKDAPLKDPIEFKLMDFNVSLRKSEADQIEVITEHNVHINGTNHYPATATEQLLTNEATVKEKVIEVTLVGNPNCGKTSLFNFASGGNERVGNYSGVTISAKEGIVKIRDYTIKIIDLPGTYSLAAFSPEEAFVRKYIIDEQPDIVINVVDASNLERNLYLTTQLIDMDITVVMALNMYDELSKKGNELDTGQLGYLLGIPIVPTTAYKGIGLKELFEEVIKIYEEKEAVLRHIHIHYGEDIEASLHAIQTEIRKNQTITDKVSSRLLAIQLLEKDKSAHLFLSRFEDYARINEVASHEIEKIEKLFHEDSSTLIAEARYGFITGALKETFVAKENKNPLSTSDKIDRILTHKAYGFPIFLAFLWLVFQTTFSVGEYPVAWIEAAVGLLSNGLGSLLPAGMIKDLIINGIIGGTGSVLVFLPNILILFFFIAIMEDTGYMARVAFIMDKLMHRLGLHGKSFIPLIIGFGCNVPAILATRTIENRKDRLLTMLIIPFMSCSARLPVYILLIGAFFPAYPVLMLFTLYLIGIALSIFFSALFNKVIFKTGQTPFVMELPPYRKPTLRSVLKHMWFRGVMYLRKVGGVILIASIVIWTLQYFPQSPDYSRNYVSEVETVKQNYEGKINAASIEPVKRALTDTMNLAISRIDAARESERMEKSYLGQLGKLIAPAFAPIGFDWKIGVSLISGIAAKEIVLSTMGVIFQDPTGGSNGTHLQTQLQHHFATINDAPAFVTAASLLVFILIYFPCLGVVSAIGRESGSWKWATFTVFYTTALAWLFSFAVFQAGRIIF